MSINLQNPYQNLMIQQSNSRFIKRKPLLVSTPKIGLDVHRYSSLSHNTSFQNSARASLDIPAPYTHALESERSMLLGNSNNSGGEEERSISNSSFRFTKIKKKPSCQLKTSGVNSETQLGFLPVINNSNEKKSNEHPRYRVFTHKANVALGQMIRQIKYDVKLKPEFFKRASNYSPAPAK